MTAADVLDLLGALLVLLGCFLCFAAALGLLRFPDVVSRMHAATKPQTLAYALHDSPVALLAWIYEKLHDWTDEYPWTDDEILTWISIYQFSRNGPDAAHRTYYETLHTEAKDQEDQSKLCSSDNLLRYTPHVKLGFSYNPKELYVLPKLWARTLGEVVFEAENDDGG